MVELKKITDHCIYCRVNFLKSEETVCCGQPHFYACAHYPWEYGRYYSISIGIGDEDDYDLYVDDLTFDNEENMLDIFKLVVEKLNDLQYEVSDNLCLTFEKYIVPFYEYLTRG